MCAQAGGMLPEPRSEEEENFIKGILEGAGAKYYAIGMKYEGNRWVWRSDEAPVTWANWLSGFPKPGKEAVWYDLPTLAWNNQGPTVYPNPSGALTVICQKNGKSFL